MTTICASGKTRHKMDVRHVLTERDACFCMRHGRVFSLVTWGVSNYGTRREKGGIDHLTALGWSFITSHPAEGKFHKYQLSSCPHFLICETLVKVMLGKARPLHPHHFRVTSASAVKQEKKKEVEVQADMDLRENPENRKKKNFI